MFPRFLFRTVCPRSLKVVTTAAQTSNRYHNVLSIYAPSICTANLVGPRRLYSQQVNMQNLTVDFDYVKKATTTSNILIVDVREPDELKEHGSIPNSINIPLGTVTTTLSQMSDNDFEQTFNRQKPLEDTEIIFYCMIGKRSGMAQNNAQKLGYKNVKNYLGSFTDWAAKTKGKN